MNRKPRKKAFCRSSVFLFTFILISASILSCDFLIPREAPAFSTLPAEDYMVLEAGRPAVLIFSEDVDSGSVESLSRIICGEESLALEKRWSGRRLELYPRESVIPGRQYRLELDGIYMSADGWEREASLSRPFYWVSRQYDPLRITGSTPEEGGIVGRRDSLYISFSTLPDPASLSRNLSISPSAEIHKEWNGSTLILTPQDIQEGWSNLMAYTLELDGELRDTSGRLLSDSWTLGFYVEEGVTPPRVVQFGACSPDRLSGFPWVTPSSLSPDYRQGIRLSFSRKMDKAETERAFSLSPTLAGEISWIKLSDSEDAAEDLVFMPEESFVMGENYTLRISSSACSGSEVEMEDDYLKTFTPSIPLLTLESMECVSSGGFQLSDFTDQCPADLPVKSPSPYDLLFRFRFSQPFPSDREKQAVQEKLSLYEIFSSGGSPRPGLYSWESDWSLTVLYSGFQADSESEYYYLLELKGGSGGIRNNQGSYLEDSVCQLMRVAKQ